MGSRASARMDRSPKTSTVAPKLTLGERQNAHEAEAERAATSVASRSTGAAPSIQNRDSGSSNGSAAAPASVRQTLRSQGSPLESRVRSQMERRFAHRFSDVRVHTDSAAAASANEIDANAYTVGKNIVFGSGRYAPQSTEGKALLAHELTHVVQNTGLAQPSVVRRQPKTDDSAKKKSAPKTPIVAPPPRKDFVFIMGEDKDPKANPFYTAALRYFKAHVPGAQFVTNVRNVTDLLSWISTNVKAPMGNVYIVSHANEDGTLSFGLNSADQDAKTSISELRGALHPAKGGSALANVKSQVDAQTKIHIKGCDIGRTQDMVELIDEAFGGLGTVTAPTHEQVFGTDPKLAADAAAKFKSEIESHHPKPNEVDKKLTGKARIAAVVDYRKQVKHRNEQIKAETAARKVEGEKVVEEANTYESLSGPMFQRPGTTLYTSKEIEPKVDATYTHLSDKQRANIVNDLIAPDKRPASTAETQGVVGQHGQRVYAKKVWARQDVDPQSAAEANTVFAQDFRQAGFRATGAPVWTTTNKSGKVERSASIPGVEGRDKTTRDYTDVILDDDAVLAEGKGKIGNPEKYAWRLATTHSRGVMTRTVVGERVIAYVHHQRIDKSEHEHFDPSESDKRYFATSTFDPNAKKPVAPPPPKKKK